MSDVRFKNALAGVPRVNVVGPDGRIVFAGCYYWAVPATTYCFKEDYEKDGHKLIEGVVTFEAGDCGVPNRPRFIKVTPPHRIVVAEVEK